MLCPRKDAISKKLRIKTIMTQIHEMDISSWFDENTEGGTEKKELKEHGFELV